MFGCLTLPFRLLGVLLVVAAAAGLWFYRDQVGGVVRGLLGDAATVEASGRADRSSLKPAVRKLADLQAGRADSVILSADETATLFATRLDPRLLRQLDSLEVRLGDDRIRIKALLHTERIPRGVFGPLNVVVRDVEPVDFAGALVVLDPKGHAEWRVREAEVRGFPLPSPLVLTLLRKAMDDSTVTGIPVTLPPGARAVRVSQAGLILYAKARE
jgi:hypothetical protein